MIRIRKPSSRPAELQKGDTKTANDCKEYMNGKRKFEFDAKIYEHEAVRSKLRDAQYCKCCYCEGEFSAFAFGHVEHYRSEGGVRQDKRSKKPLVPGYYWLVHSWDNLLWSCRECNVRKSDLFLLANPDRRVRSHMGDVNCEVPLIVDRGGSDDPKLHIRFDDDLAVGITEKRQFKPLNLIVTDCRSSVWNI